MEEDKCWMTQRLFKSKLIYMRSNSNDQNKITN